MADVRAQLQSGLSDRYTLERELGRGGMATVFLAQDMRHKRPVALKVLHADLAHALGVERFQREIELVARLQHPHILTVLDSGEVAGQLWFTMPYVEGESLRDRLRREHQLPLDDAIRIATETARALDYAHRHDVVHRDIKPENILLTKDGDTLVADFGIARALTGGTERLTETGMSLGTAAYMSPEQAAGDRQTDARTDTYSLGSVLYEMLAGEPPFTGPTTQAIIAKRFTGEVPHVRVMRPSVPEPVDAAITRALAPIAADRFATVAEFARALAPGATALTSAATASAPISPAVGTAAPSTTGRSGVRRVPSGGLTLLLIGFLVGVGVLFAWRRSSSGDTSSSAGDAHSVAVLPFENLGDSADAYFADGVTDAVRGKLTELPGMRVIARGSSNQYRASTKTPQQIGSELGVHYLLTATVRWQKAAAGGVSRVQVSPELIAVRDASTKWQQPFDASLTDVFQVQADIAAKVASALNVALGDSAKRTLAAAPTANLAAYDAFLKGEAASQSASTPDPPSLRRAIAYYEQAVALDTAFVAAWGQLSRVRTTLNFNSVPTPELARKSREAAERAEALAPGGSWGALALTNYYHTVEIDNPRALSAVEAALRGTPNNAELLAAAGVVEQSLGRWEAALQHFRRSHTLDPRSATTARRYTASLIFLRRYPEAIAAADTALTLAPTNLAIIENRMIVALAQGDLAGARAVLEASSKQVERAALLAYIAQYYDLVWVPDESGQEQLLALTPASFDGDRGAWSLVLAQLYYLRGELPKARAYADTARQGMVQQLRTVPDDGQRHALHGLALAYLGRKAEAVQEAERGAQLVPLSRDAYFGVYVQHQLARTYVICGEQEKALAVLERLLGTPYFLTPSMLRIDPNFAALKGNPRFERLIAAR